MNARIRKALVTRGDETPAYSHPGGSTSVRLKGSLVEVKMTSSGGVWHAATYTPEQARDLIIALDAILEDTP